MRPTYDAESLNTLHAVAAARLEAARSLCATAERLRGESQALLGCSRAVLNTVTPAGTPRPRPPALYLQDDDHEPDAPAPRTVTGRVEWRTQR